MRKNAIYLKAHDTKIILNANTHHYQNEKKNANLYTLGVESLTSAPGEARYSNEFTKKKVRNLDKAVHFQRGLRAILYKFEFAKYKKKNLNRLYTCSAFSRPVKRSQNQVLDLDTVTVKKSAYIHVVRLVPRSQLDKI